ncbi:hypothetical protein J6A31_09185 [bacterium]|nr:hypothetical protein [bacterium]
MYYDVVSSIYSKNVRIDSQMIKNGFSSLPAAERYIANNAVKIAKIKDSVNDYIQITNELIITEIEEHDNNGMLVQIISFD